MEVTEDPNLTLVFFFDLLHESFHSDDLGMKSRLWVDPLPIQVDSSKRVTIVAAYDTVWVHYWNEYKCVKPSQVLGFTTIRGYEVINATKDFTARSLS